jgi:hypothetical protein
MIRSKKRLEVSLTNSPEITARPKVSELRTKNPAARELPRRTGRSILASNGARALESTSPTIRHKMARRSVDSALIRPKQTVVGDKPFWNSPPSRLGNSTVTHKLESSDENIFV